MFIFSKKSAPKTSSKLPADASGKTGKMNQLGQMGKAGKTGITELVFILDRSGSMCGLEADTIGGFNSMLAQQKALPGEAFVTTVLFDDRYELLHDHKALQRVAPLTDKDYTVRGCTALLDALGRTITDMVRLQRLATPERRADRVLFVITTDGYENASRQFRPEQVRQMVEKEQEEYGWEFLFLGANMDAIATAQQYGIRADRAVTTDADSTGTIASFEAINHAVCCARGGMAMDDSWKAPVEAARPRMRRGK